MNDSIEGERTSIPRKGGAWKKKKRRKERWIEKISRDDECVARDGLFRKKVAIDEIKNGTRMVYDSRIDELYDEGTSCGFQIKKRRRRERMSISTR